MLPEARLSFAGRLIASMGQSPISAAHAWSRSTSRTRLSAIPRAEYPVCGVAALTLRVEATDATLGAVITGVQIAALDDAEWCTIEAAFNEHGVLIFPDQHPSHDEQVAFGRRFGELDSLVAKTGPCPSAIDFRRSAARGHESNQAVRGSQGIPRPIRARAILYRSLTEILPTSH